MANTTQQTQPQIIYDPNAFYDAEDNVNAKTVETIKARFLVKPEGKKDDKGKIVLTLDDIAKAFYEGQQRFKDLEDAKDDLATQSQILLGKGNLSLFSAANPTEQLKLITTSLREHMQDATAQKAENLIQYTNIIDPYSTRKMLTSSPVFTITKEEIINSQTPEFFDAYNEVAKAIQKHQLKKELIEGSQDTRGIGKTLYAIEYLKNIEKNDLVAINFLMGGEITNLEKITKTLMDNSEQKAYEAIASVGIPKYISISSQKGNQLRKNQEREIKRIRDLYDNSINDAAGEQRIALVKEKQSELEKIAIENQDAATNFPRLYKSLTRTVNKAVEKYTEQRQLEQYLAAA
jgi:hypothetical protein